MALTLIFVAGPTTSGPAQAATAWNVGDVFLGVSGGSYQVRDNAGALKETINDGLGGFTTGCAFDAAGDLYTTNFSNTKVVKYDDVSPHNILQVIDTNAHVPGGQSESIVFAGNGDFYVGHPDGNDDILRYDAAGTFQQAYNVAIDARGSDWMDLAADQQTMFYTGEGRRILRYDVAGDAQLADFAVLPGTGVAFALRLLPPGDGTGGLLVADSGNIKRLDGAGAVSQTYDVAGENSWFSLNLDPNGTSFWAGDFSTANYYRFNIASGAVEVGPINTGTGSSTLFGICVLGEPTAAGGPNVDKDLRFTSVNFTPTDPDTGELLPAELGGLLPATHDDEFGAVVKVHKNGNVQNTNPGQLYGVVSVSNAAGLESFWFHDEFDDQFDVNPAQLGGGVEVIVVDGDGFATVLTDILKYDLAVDWTVDNETNMVWLDVPVAEALGRPLDGDETLMIYVKFGPSPEFKGQLAPSFPDHWDNWGFIDLDHEGDQEPIDAHAILHLTEK